MGRRLADGLVGIAQEAAHHRPGPRDGRSGRRPDGSCARDRAIGSSAATSSQSDASGSSCRRTRSQGQTPRRFRTAGRGIARAA